MNLITRSLDISLCCEPYQVSSAQWLILLALVEAKCKPLMMRDVCRRLGSLASALNSGIEALRSKGRITVDFGSGTQSCSLTLTPKGMALVRTVLEEAKRMRPSESPVLAGAATKVEEVAA